MPQKIVILTEGGTNPHTGKTAASVVRYRGDEVVALLDSQQAGKTSGKLLGVGGETPIVASVADVPGATTLLLGTAPPGGRIPNEWREIILDAISHGLDVVAGLHDFLTEDPEFVAAAKQHNVELTDVRKTNENEIALRVGLRPDCLRVLTVGHDCSVGKMVTAIELTKSLKELGLTSKFIATGQTGIMIEGDGCPIDHVISDFVSGAVEKMVLQQQDHDVLMIEGQGSLAHPSYSAVTLGLIHGALPQAMILCYQIGRDRITGLEHLKIPPLAQIKEMNEAMASIYQPGKVIGIAMNSATVGDSEAEAERKRVGDEFGLPVCDVIRHGCGDLVNAIVKFRDSLDWRVDATQ
jgi:uncharacterized NAD-dependent epimerase/dehydratase family protein